MQRQNNVGEMMEKDLKKVNLGDENTSHFQRRKIPITPLPPLNTGIAHFYLNGIFLFLAGIPGQGAPSPPPARGGSPLPRPGRAAAATLTSSPTRGSSRAAGGRAGQEGGDAAPGTRDP